MSTTIATLAGLQDKILADSTVKFRLRSQLYDAVNTVASEGTAEVQFYGASVPTAAAKQSGSNSVSVTTISSAKVTANLIDRPVLVRLENRAENASSIDYISNQIAGQIAVTVDSEITDLFSDFAASGSTAATDAISGSDFFAAATALKQTKYIGDKIFVVSPTSWETIGSSIMTNYNQTMESQEQMTNGYIGWVGGVKIYVSSDVKLVSGVYQNAMFFKEAIGLGYADPLLKDMHSGFNRSINNMEYFANTSIMGVIVTNAAGIILHDKVQ